MNFVNCVCTGLKDGIDPGIFELPKETYVCRNNKSAHKQPSDIDHLKDNEVNRRYMLGPFKDSPFGIFRVSPIDIAEGKYSKKKNV